MSQALSQVPRHHCTVHTLISVFCPGTATVTPSPLIFCTRRITPLHAACRNGDLASTQALLNALESSNTVHEVISTRDQEGSVCLHSAAVSGDVGVIAHLLRASADVHATDAIGSTPLHAAAEAGHVAAIEVLTAAGSDPNASNTVGNTPLHRAARRGLADAVQALCALGADPVRRLPLGCSPSTGASEYGCGMTGLSALLQVFHPRERAN